MSETEQNRRETSAPEPGPQGAKAAGEAGAGPFTADGDLEALRNELDEVTRKGQEYLNLAQRAQADLVNYRRRVEQERGESFQAGKAEVALTLLPVLDDFDRALQARPSDLAQNDWAQGIDLIARKLRAALESRGISRIDALGKEFDPWQHEAVMQGPSAPEEEGKVVEVFREGYKLGDKVLRPAQVKVGSGSPS